MRYVDSDDSEFCSLRNFLHRLGTKHWDPMPPRFLQSRPERERLRQPNHSGDVSQTNCTFPFRRLVLKSHCCSHLPRSSPKARPRFDQASKRLRCSDLMLRAALQPTHMIQTPIRTPAREKNSAFLWGSGNGLPRRTIRTRRS